MPCDCLESPSFEKVVELLRQKEAFHLQQNLRYSRTKIEGIAVLRARNQGQADACTEILEQLAKDHTNCQSEAERKIQTIQKKLNSLFSRIVEQLNKGA